MDCRNRMRLVEFLKVVASLPEAAFKEMSESLLETESRPFGDELLIFQRSTLYTV